VPATGVSSRKPGEELRRLRNRLDLTTREVEEYSRRIAVEQKNDEYAISHGRVIQLENDDSTPSLQKLFSLSAIYGVRLMDLMSLYLDVESISRYQLEMPLSRSRIVDFEPPPPGRLMAFPVRFDPGFNPSNTTMLSRLIEAWGDVPVGILQNLGIRQRYGFIGLDDYMMYPLLQPGSFVQIEETHRFQTGVYRAEIERPIYFIELRSGYMCCWCDLQKNKLLAIPHPLSPCRIQEFAYPQDAEIVGRVSAFAAKLGKRPDAKAKSDGGPVPNSV
jgi:transcriptional regulator with XRE-family HTH domain